MAKARPGRADESGSAREPPGNEGPEPAQKKKDQTSLKVDQEEGQLVGKVAGMRGVSIANLFKMKDVNDFFTHLLIEEMRKETERLQAKKKT